MEKLTGSNIITLINKVSEDETLLKDVKDLTKEDFDFDDLLVKLFFEIFPDGFASANFDTADKEIMTTFADLMTKVKGEVSKQGLRKAHSIIQNIRSSSNVVVERENEFNKINGSPVTDSQFKAAQLVSFLSKYIDGNENKVKLANALRNIHQANFNDAGREIHAVYERYFPEQNIKTAFVTPLNQVGEPYQLCAKGIYIWGHAVPTATSNCRDYCIDARVHPDGSVGCNYVKWLNESLITQEQAMNLFDKMPMKNETMNLKPGERSKFPMSDQDSQDQRIIRDKEVVNVPWETQLEKEHGEPKKIDDKYHSKIVSDKAIETLLATTRDVFDEDDLDTLEQKIQELIGE